MSKYQLLKLSAIVFAILGWITSCKKPERLPPVASFEVDTRIGYPGLLFAFDASMSHDPDNSASSLMARWDFNGDAIWETEYQKQMKQSWIYDSPGIKKVILEIIDPDGLKSTATDTIVVFKPNRDSTMIDLRDGQIYNIVELDGTWWMSENLKFGTWLPSTQNQKDNQTVEYYAYDDNPLLVQKYGGLYLWEEAMNYDRQNSGGICPDGWSIPTPEDFDKIDMVAPYQFIADYYGEGGFSGLNLQLGGIWSSTDNTGKRNPYFHLSDSSGFYLTTEYRDFDRFDQTLFQCWIITHTIINYPGLYFGFLANFFGDYWENSDRSVIRIRNAYSVRCIK